MTLLEQKLQQLNLSAMTRNLETTIAEAAAKNLSVAATLEWLADMELEARQHRAIERRFKCARLQTQLSIDAFHFHHHKSRVQAKNRILRLLDLTSFGLPRVTQKVRVGTPKLSLSNRPSRVAPVVGQRCLSGSFARIPKHPKAHLRT